MKGRDNMKYDKKLMNRMADDLENYIDIIESYIIIEGITEEEYEESLKTVRKLIKKLRKGKGDEVFDKDRYLELLKDDKLHV